MNDRPLPPPRSTPIPSTEADLRAGTPPVAPLPPPPGGPLASPPSELPAAPVAGPLPAGATSAVPGSDAAAARPRSRKAPRWTGILFAAGVGAMLLTFVDPWLPRRSEPGRIVDTEIVTTRRRVDGRTRTDTDHVVRGRTEDGDRWEVVARDLYDEVTIGDAVTVEFSRVSGGVVGVEGPGYDFDKSGGWLRYLYVALGALFVVLAIVVRPDDPAARPKWKLALAGGFVLGILGAVIYL